MCLSRREREARDCRRARSKATVLIETILAAFEMDEILWELQEHSAGLNCGRWDYIFSFIKKFASGRRGRAARSRAGDDDDALHAELFEAGIKTCHRRNVSAMGGMSAYIPIKSDPVANEKAIAQVRADKEREATRWARWDVGGASGAGAGGAGGLRSGDAAAEPDLRSNCRTITRRLPICCRFRRARSPRPG